MKRIIALCTTALFLIATLTGCNEDKSSPASQQVETPVVVPDVTFSGVPRSVYKTTVRPGEQNVELVSFRAFWKEPITYKRGKVDQLVFKNKSSVPSADLFKSFPRLLNGQGKDMSTQYYYFVSYRDDDIVIDFYFGWYEGMYSEDVPNQTYSLAADIAHGVADNVDVVVEFEHARMHDYQQNAVDSVVGEPLRVVTVVGAAPPSVSSYGNYSLIGVTPGVLADMGMITISCPSDNTVDCALKTAEFNVGNVRNVYFGNSDGSIFSTLHADSNNSNKFVLDNSYWGFSPGSVVTFRLYVEPISNYVWAELSRMSFDVGGAIVSPILPTNLEACSTLVADREICQQR